MTRNFTRTVEEIDVTRGPDPTSNFPGDPYRVFTPGMPHWFIDGEEVTQTEWEAEYAKDFPLPVEDM